MINVEFRGVGYSNTELLTLGEAKAKYKNLKYNDELKDGDLGYVYIHQVFEKHFMPVTRKREQLFVPTENPAK